MNKDVYSTLINKNIKDVVFYGISQSEIDISKYKYLNIYFMDMDEPINCEQRCYIDNLEDAAKHNIKAFVIMRQMIANRRTFNDIIEYCIKYDAEIYDEYGRNIGMLCMEAKNKKACTKNELEKNIAGHEFISFDIFDTLLMRKVLRPEDVFSIMEARLAKKGINIDKFQEKRIEAQSVLGLANPNLHDIYAEFQKLYNIEEARIRQCMEMELNIEREVLIPRHDMVEVFNYCVKKKKKVYLISDMYMTKEQLLPILNKNGIIGFSDIYISCENKKLKLQGLFKEYLQDVKKTGNETFLHIGDHIIHDVICAQLEGMDCCLIEESYKMAQHTAFKELLNKPLSLTERIMLGLSISCVLNSPFSIKNNSDSIFIRNDADYAYGFCGALLGLFTIFMYNTVKERQVDDILFAARDGYMIKEMYHMLREKKQDWEAPEGIYFYTSRKASVMTCIDNEAYINMLIDMSTQMQPEMMMKERFGLDEKDVMEYDSEKHDIYQYVWAHADKIFARSHRAKINYFKYMGNAGLKIGKKYAFMDFVSSGTSQKSLSKIVPFELVGIYAGWNSTEDCRKYNVNSLYSDLKTYFLKYYKIMETFMTSDEPSLSCFDDNGKPVFQKQERSKKEINYVQEMQNGCIMYFDDFLQLSNDIEWQIGKEFTDNIFEVGRYVKIDVEDSILNNLSLMDDWSQVRLNREMMIQNYDGGN